MDSAHIWVVRRVASLLSWPPRAMVAPRILSLSIMGRSPQVTTTCEKIILGSGEYGLTLTCFRRCMDVSTQWVVTTGIMMACDSVNCSKSIVFEMMCVTLSMGKEPLRFGSQMVAPFSVRMTESCKLLVDTSKEVIVHVNVHHQFDVLSNCYSTRTRRSIR